MIRFLIKMGCLGCSFYILGFILFIILPILLIAIGDGKISF